MVPRKEQSSHIRLVMLLSDYNCTWANSLFAVPSSVLNTYGIPNFVFIPSQSHIIMAYMLFQFIELTNAIIFLWREDLLWLSGFWNNHIFFQNPFENESQQTSKREMKERDSSLDKDSLCFHWLILIDSLISGVTFFCVGKQVFLKVKIHLNTDSFRTINRIALWLYHHGHLRKWVTIQRKSIQLISFISN